MKNLFELSRKHEKYVVGLMSGTSVDAVDVALVKIDGNGVNIRLEMVGFMEYPIPPEIKKMILRNSVKETSNVEEITILNFILPQIYVNAIKELCDEIKFPINEIDLIGSHGQTIQHLPNAGKLFGFNAASTLETVKFFV